MAKTLMKALHTEMTADLPAVAALLQKKGRGKDTILAHITPKEAALLRERGGRGSKNPDTGLLEFENESDYAFDMTPAPAAPSPTPAAETGFGQGDYAQANPYGGGVMKGDTVIRTPNAPEDFPAAPAPSAPVYTGPAPFTEFPQTQVPQAFQIPAGQAIAAQDLAGLQRDYTGAVQPPAAPKEKGFLDSLGLGGVTGGQALGAGALGLLGAYQARKASEQGQQAKQDLLNQAAPYQQQGARQVAAAQAGQLSAASQQAYEAARAKAAQSGMAAGGGVGVVQSQAALESFRQQLLAGDLNIGLQIQAIGDKIAQGAIQAGVQADQYVNSLTGNYAMNVGRVLMGATPGTPTTTQTPVA